MSSKKCAKKTRAAEEEEIRRRRNEVLDENYTFESIFPTVFASVVSSYGTKITGISQAGINCCVNVAVKLAAAAAQESGRYRRRLLDSAPPAMYHRT